MTEPAVPGPADEPPFRLDRETVLAVAAVLSLLIGLARFGTDVPAPVWMRVVDVAFAVAFFADWLDRVLRSPRRGRYALRNAWEAVTWIPFTVIPLAPGGDVLRGARLVRFVRMLRYARYARVGVGLARLPRRLGQIRRVAEHAQVVTIALVGVVIVAAGAALFLVLERGTNEHVRGYGDALWWSLNLFTTVAYDAPPAVTSGGRVVAGALMVLGVAYIGVFTASLAGAILEENRRREE